MKYKLDQKFLIGAGLPWTAKRSDFCHYVMDATGAAICDNSTSAEPVIPIAQALIAHSVTNLPLLVAAVESYIQARESVGLDDEIAFANLKQALAAASELEVP